MNANNQNCQTIALIFNITDILTYFPVRTHIMQIKHHME